MASSSETDETQEALVPAQGVGIPQVEGESPYYNALLSVIAIVQETGACDDDSLKACLEAEGIGEFYSYAQILLEATAGEDFQEGEEVDPANPEQENDADASDEDPEE